MARRGRRFGTRIHGRIRMHFVDPVAPVGGYIAVSIGPQHDRHQPILRIHPVREVREEHQRLFGGKLVDDLSERWLDNGESRAPAYVLPLKHPPASLGQQDVVGTATEALRLIP